MIKRSWASDAHFKTMTTQNHPELAKALEKGDNKEIGKIIGKKMTEQMEAQKKEQERRIKLMNADPNDEAAQKEIEEMIRKEMVNNNYLTAQEQFPEFFGQITMIYVDVKVNKHPIQAFVDSGA